MSRKIYSKLPTTFDEQVNIWKKRGLQVPDTFRIQSYLSHISYYRLSAYCLPFQQVKDQFDSNTTFDDILGLYLFDRELRLLIFDAIERIEVGLRTQIIYKMAHKHDSHWHENEKLFVTPYTNKNGKTIDPFADMQYFFNKQYKNKDPEVFIKHYFDNYDNPPTPPSWMAIELLTIGGLSRLFSNFKEVQDKKMIAQNYGLPTEVFESWIHALTHLRNLSAHHCRVWNRVYRIYPKWLNKPQYNWIVKDFDINNRTFYYLNVLKYFLNIINPNNTFKNKIEMLFLKYPNVKIEYLGIPTDHLGKIIDWKLQPLWKN